MACKQGAECLAALAVFMGMQLDMQICLAMPCPLHPFFLVWHLFGGLVAVFLAAVREKHVHGQAVAIAFPPASPGSVGWVGGG
jgi:hypothetical protein